MLLARAFPFHALLRFSVPTPVGPASLLPSEPSSWSSIPTSYREMPRPSEYLDQGELSAVVIGMGSRDREAPEIQEVEVPSQMEPGPWAEEHVREGCSRPVEWNAEIAGDIEDKVTERDMMRGEITAHGQSAGE